MMPPKARAGATVGIGMVWCGGIPSSENANNLFELFQLNIKVSSDYLSFFALPNFQFMFLQDIDPISPNVHSMV